MEEPQDNPIIQRLKQFIAHTGLSSTQFADKAAIPRPTLSQLLHGRNKSINNQILAKLDESFPDLDIVWLLFGRGTMRQNLNFEISEPQNDDSLMNFGSQEPVIQAAKEEDMPVYGLSDSKQSRQKSMEMPNLSPQEPRETDESPSSRPWTASVLCSPPDGEVNIPIGTNPRKRIKSIIVLYTDNSFDTFNSFDD